MHNNNLVVAVKVNGKVLRETNATVTLPFSSEFSILIKNLNSVRTQVAVSIDGQDATDGTRLILQPNSSLELERFVRNGNLQTGNKFKFIERTKEVEEHRGIGAEDGIVRVEAWREQLWNAAPQSVTCTYSNPYYTHWLYNNYLIGGLYGSSVGSKGSSLSANLAQTATTAQNFSCSTSGTQSAFTMQEAERGQSDAGITVPGSESSQQFYASSGFSLEPVSSVVVLRLRGAVAGSPVQAARTVEQKPKCLTCGRINKATNQFCGTCGTALTIL